MKNLKKSLVVILVLSLFVTILAGCTNSPSAAEQPTTKVFTDSVGRQVEVPVNPERIAPSGTLAQLQMYTLAPEKLVGWGTKPTPDMEKYFEAKYLDLPVFGGFYGAKANFNMEEVIAANPQIIVDIGGIKPNMAADLDALQTQLGIPVVFIEANLENTGEAYRKLGELLDMVAEAKPFADYCDQTIQTAKANSAKIPENEKVTVYYGEGENGLEASPKGSIHAQVLDLIGAKNVAEIQGAGKNSPPISIEQLILWNPSVIIFGPDNIWETASTNPLLKDLKAIKDHKYYEIPAKPFNWIDRPPAINRILGVKWLGNLIYPDLYEYDMVKEAQEFYKLFYHYDLTDAEANELMAKSTFAQY